MVGTRLAMNEKQLRLYDIPKESKIYGLTDLKGSKIVVIFHHLDGAYSYCHIEGHEDDYGPQHLSAPTPLEKYKDGYRIIEEAKDE